MNMEGQCGQMGLAELKGSFLNPQGFDHAVYLMGQGEHGGACEQMGLPELTNCWGEVSPQTPLGLR